MWRVSGVSQGVCRGYLMFVDCPLYFGTSLSSSYLSLFKNFLIYLAVGSSVIAGSLVVACGNFSCSIRALSCRMWDLVPWAGIEPGSPALRAGRISPWNTREVPILESWWTFWTPAADTEQINESLCFTLIPRAALRCLANLMLLPDT